MDFNRFTEKLQEAVRAAQSIAVQHGNQQIDTEHLMLALLDQEGGLAPSILNKSDIRVDALRTRFQQEVDRMPKVSGASGGPDQVYVTNRITKLLSQAEDEAKRLKDDYVSVEHVLLAATEDQGATGKLFREFGITRERLMRALQEVRGSQRVTTQNPEATYEALEKYGRDLTQFASQGKLDPVIGRDEEIRRVIQVLSRRTKNKLHRFFGNVAVIGKIRGVAEAKAVYCASAVADPDGRKLEPKKIDGRAVEDVRYQPRPRGLRVALIEDIAKSEPQRADSFLRPIDRDHTALPVVERPHIIQPHHVIGMRMRKQNRVHPFHARAQGLVAEVGRGIYQHAPVAVLDVHRRPQAVVPRIFGMADGAAAADHRHSYAGA